MRLRSFYITLTLIALCPVLCLGNPSVDKFYEVFQQSIQKDSLPLILTKLAYKVRRTHPDTAYKYAQIALKYSRKYKEWQSEKRALNIMGVAQKYLGNYDTALEFHFQALQLQKARTGHGSYSTFNHIATSYKIKGRYDFALEYYQKALHRAKEINETRSQASVLNNIGNVYRQKGDFDAALDYQTQALEIREKLKDLKGISYSYNNIGNIYMSRRNQPMGLEYYRKALNLKKKLNDEYLLGPAYINMGHAFVMGEDLDSALYYLRMAEEHYTKRKAIQEKSTTFRILGEVLLKKGQIEEARKYLEFAYEIAKEKEMLANLIQSSVHLGNFHREIGEYETALTYYKEAINKARETGSKPKLALALERIAATYQLIGETEKGYSYLMQSMQIKDSIPILEGEHLARDIHAKYAIEKKEQEIAMIKKDEKIFRLNIMGVIGFLLLVLFVCIVLILQNRYSHQTYVNKLLTQQRKKVESKNMKLAMYNKELEEFAYAVSHDLKQPLRTIGCFASLLERRYGTKMDEEGKEYINFVTDGVDQMSHLLSDLLAYTQIEKNAHIREEVDLNQVVVRAIDSLTPQVLEKGGTVLVEHLPNIQANPRGLYLLITNLLSNAIKFTGNLKPKIEIGYDEDESHHILRFKDNGIGIDPQYREKIFVIFQRLHNKSNYDGNGIGLAICQKVANLHGGRISFESSPGNGTTFYVSLPKG